MLYPEIKVLFPSFCPCLSDLCKLYCILIFIKKIKRISKRTEGFFSLSQFYLKMSFHKISRMFLKHTKVIEEKTIILPVVASIFKFSSLYSTRNSYNKTWQYHVAFLCLTNKSYTYMLYIYTCMYLFS